MYVWSASVGSDRSHRHQLRQRRRWQWLMPLSNQPQPLPRLACRSSDWDAPAPWSLTGRRKGIIRCCCVRASEHAALGCQKAHRHARNWPGCKSMPFDGCFFKQDARSCIASPWIVPTPLLNCNRRPFQSGGSGGPLCIRLNSMGSDLGKGCPHARS